MNDFLFFAGILAGWIVLNIWILPWFGIRTCMSGACRVPRGEQAEARISVDKAVHVNKNAREADRS